MSDLVFQMVKPLLRSVDPETAHEMTIKSLEAGMVPRPAEPSPKVLETRLMGLDIANPIGVAAGFDKDARVPDAILKMGFGFAEVGTLTPKPEVGNDKPRVFRLPADRAIINRYGFNNCGHAAALERLRERKRVGCVGVNIGANKDSDDRVADYVSGITAFYDVASYFMVNVSSPNTPGLRDLEAADQMRSLLEAVLSARNDMADRKGRRVPVAVKLSPDSAAADLPALCEVLVAAGVDAIAVSNTTVTRPAGLAGPSETLAETGGLSGRPLFERSTAMLAEVRRLTGGAIGLIGIGGIDSGDRALEKVLAGADAIQVYTGLVFEGPGLLERMRDALEQAVYDTGVGNIAGLVGRNQNIWCARWAEMNAPSA